LVTGCVGPSRTDTDFRHKAANTAETVSGIIGTVQVALAALARNGVPAPYLSVTIAEADDDASAVVDTFDSVQPPSEQADDLRSKLDDVLQQAVSTLDDLRIAVRRGELRELPQRAGSLASFRERLQQLMDVA
jgi:hypothetical protein